MAIPVSRSPPASCGTEVAGSRQSYYPYGAVRTAASSLPTDITFTGQRSDASTGLMFYNARYYSPVVGRFVSADTVVPGASNPQAWNRYSYTVNNPVKYTDPSGHSLCSDGMSACSASGLFYFPPPPPPSSAASLRIQLAILAGGPVVALMLAQAAASDAAQDANDAAGSEDSLYNRGHFRKETIEGAKKEAPKNEDGEMICPTCGEVIPETIETQSGTTRRGFDLDHFPDTWAERVEKLQERQEAPTRKEVLDEYNRDVRIQCPPCNQSHQWDGKPGDYQ